jgi:hypothetical protein
MKCGGLTRKSKAILVVLEAPQGLRCCDNKFSLVTDLEVMASLRVPVAYKKRRRYARNHQNPLYLVV